MPKTRGGTVLRSTCNFVQHDSHPRWMARTHRCSAADALYMTYHTYLILVVIAFAGIYALANSTSNMTRLSYGPRSHFIRILGLVNACDSTFEGARCGRVVCQGMYASAGAAFLIAAVTAGSMFLNSPELARNTEPRVVYE